MKQFFLLLFFISAFSTQIWATQVKGVVRDVEGEAIPYAKVYVEKSTTGVVTNIKGEYYMELPAGTHRLVFSSLGYKTETKEVVVKSSPITLDVTLMEEGVELETVTVTAGRKDPAYAIMEKVIANKKTYIQQFESFQCETYLKASLEVDTLVRKKIEFVDSTTVDSTLAPALEDNGSVELFAKFFEKRALKKEARLAAKARKKEIKDSLNAPIHLSSLKDGSQDSVVARKKRGPAPKKKDERPKLNLIESQSTTYFQYAGLYKSVVHAYRDFSEKRSRTVSVSVSGADSDRYETVTNNPYLFYLDVSDADFNFYHNLVTVPKLSDQPFISPLSATSWNLSYKYHLEESFYEDGYVIHKIIVTPRNSEGPFFQGELYIEDGSWAIKSVNFQILPTNLSYFKYFQLLLSYERTGDGRWVKAREDYYYNVKEGKVRYYGNTIALHTNHQLDVQHPKGFFKNELRRVEQQAFERDSLYWEDMRPVTLKEAERDFIAYQDSVYKYKHSAPYLHEVDSIYNRLTIWDILFNGMGFRMRKQGMTFNFDPISQQVKPLGVGGYRHVIGGSISKKWTKYNRLTLSGDLDIGVQNKDIRGQGKLAYLYNPKHFASGYIRYGDKYEMVNSNSTIITIFSRSNFVRKTHFGFGHEMEILNGLFLDVSGEYADYATIADLQLEQWSQQLFGSSNSPQVFDPYTQARIIAKLKWIPGQKYYTEPYRKVIVGSIWPTFELEYRKAIPGIIGSQINYDYLELNVTDEMRIGTMGISRWAAYAGSYLQKNNIRFTDYRFFRGSDPIFFANPLRSFQNLDTTLSTTNPFIQVNYLHDFGSALSNKIPVLKHTPIQFSAGAGFLAIPDINFLHAEVYGGIQLPFKINTQRFKLGGYYAVSYSNYEGSIGNQFKVGITFYDSFKGKWTY
ncbi:MAG: carboxypeptidase-like regulatory domain-containing protein [Bacteroidetes bacterium]|nr:carboxypeptidase-like regulatory domain-containing protein [Bacteroidota bacterium]MBL0016977.1 carboxypeptidase-like regulatory domain-containing protein [Bacteroidota bacterium]MBP8073159.1 carboxypeptidase-like regulatory domain-containing protein [Bacteroidia bacterium]